MKYYAIWIDHARALVVKAENIENVNAEEILSGMEPHHHGGETEERLLIVNQHKDDNRRHESMKAFLKNILHRLAGAEEIHILGPGNAKFDLKNAIEEDHILKAALKSCETVDKMSKEELIAHVRKTLGL